MNSATARVALFKTFAFIKFAPSHKTMQFIFAGHSRILTRLRRGFALIGVRSPLVIARHEVPKQSSAEPPLRWIASPLRVRNDGFLRGIHPYELT
jgi:hypothetical protein